MKRKQFEEEQKKTHTPRPGFSLLGNEVVKSAGRFVSSATASSRGKKCASFIHLFEYHLLVLAQLQARLLLLECRQFSLLVRRQGLKKNTPGLKGVQVCRGGAKSCLACLSG